MRACYSLCGTADLFGPTRIRTLSIVHVFYRSKKVNWLHTSCTPDTPRCGCEEPQKNPKQATGVVSSLEGSQARRCAEAAMEAAPHAQRLKHCAVSMNLVSSMPTTLTVSSAGTFPRRVVVQRESNVSQPGKRLAAAGAERAEGSSKKRDQTRPHTSRTACGEAAIAEGFLRLLARATPRCDAGMVTVTSVFAA